MIHETLASLAAAVEGKLRHEREQADPNESCGIIFDDGTITRLPNESDDPQHSYQVSKRTLSLAMDARNRANGRRKALPVGIYHSHVVMPAEPSLADVRQLVKLSKNNEHPPLMFITGMDGLRIWAWNETVVEMDWNE